MSAKNTTRGSHAGAFSLVELVIVVVLVGIVAAIAVPRLEGQAQRTASKAVTYNVNRFQQALELYQVEHDGAAPDADDIAQQLTQYTDADGNVSAVKDNKHIYGPYLAAIPPVSFGPNKGNTAIGSAPGVNVGWIYNPATPAIRPNGVAWRRSTRQYELDLDSDGEPDNVEVLAP